MFLLLLCGAASVASGTTEAAAFLSFMTGRISVGVGERERMRMPTLISELGKIGPYQINSIYTGDARELALALPDESVDLIFTDPVYDRIDDYRWLAQTAERVLKPGGSVIAQVGTTYRYEAETAMRYSVLMQLPLLAEIF